MNEACIVILGAGYSGSIMAAILNSLGFQVTLIEKSTHPRFAIGESSTPIANYLLEFLGMEFNLPYLWQISNWRRWRTHHPDLPVGLKRGFSFAFHKPGSTILTQETMRVAASPDDDVADTHWYRPSLDHYLLKQAVHQGVNYLENTHIQSMEWQKDYVDIHVISGSHSTKYHLRADFVIDASGNGSLTRFFPDSQSGPAAFLPKQKAVFAHFQDVGRLDEIHPPGPIPYPTDEAALHHVFPGGWMWVLHFNNGLTSAGFSLTTSGHFKESCLLEPARAWNEMVSQFPTIQEQFRHAKPVTPINQSQEVSFCRNICAGNRWVSLPSAYGFTDPLLSTGFALNLTGIARLALFIKSAGWDVEKMGRFLLDYQTQTKEDFKESARYVGALLESLASPEHFRNKALVYFTAAIQQETRMRLHHLLPTTGFLYRSNSPWREAAHKILGSPHIVSGWRQALEPFDLAGLTDESRGLQFPATPEDLIKNHYKIPASISEIDHMMKMSRNIQTTMTHHLFDGTRFKFMAPSHDEFGSL